jgi:polyether ionophore transport system permease protein
MTTVLEPRPSPGRAAGSPASGPLTGLGSVFGKTLRDSRRAFVLEAGILGGLMLMVFAAIAAAYPTQAGRDELARLADRTGVAAQGLTGKPVNVATIGGYVEWKYGAVFLLAVALWSIRSLTGLLAGEAACGSLDVLAAAPLGRRRLAAEKVAAHLTLLSLVTVVVGFCAWLAGAAFGKLPGDGVPPRAAVGFALWVGLMAIAFGGLAFALAQFVGRTAASWIAGAVLVAGPVLNNYRSLEPAFGWVADLTPAAWTADHLPLSGRYDWLSLAPVALLALVLVPAGVEAFARRDLGTAGTGSFRALVRPPAGFGLRGPAGRSLGERWPLALAWGGGLGAFGVILAAASRALADQLTGSPDLARTFRRAFPDFDLTTAGGFLQLTVQLLYAAVGFAAVTLLSGWAGDETSGRLEMVLASTLSRRSWVIRSGLGVYAAIGLTTLVTALAVGLGAATSGSEVFTPMLGTFCLGLFGVALAGVGIAIGGWIRPSLAGPSVAAVVVATYLIDLVIPALHLPDGVHQLALTAHLGRPMVGDWDLAGVLACVALAAGGLLVGSLGMARRDLRG